MREVGYISTKLHFTNSWVHKPLKYTPFVSPCERRSESAHDHCLVGFVFKRATHSIPCSSAGGYQTVLHYCERPLLVWEWVVCIRRKASCTEPRGPYRDGSGRIHLPGNPYILDMTLWLSVKLLWNCVLWKRWINQSNLLFSAVFSRFFSLCVSQWTVTDTL